MEAESITVNLIVAAINIIIILSRAISWYSEHPDCSLSEYTIRSGKMMPIPDINSICLFIQIVLIITKLTTPSILALIF